MNIELPELKQTINEHAKMFNTYKLNRNIEHITIDSEHFFPSFTWKQKVKHFFLGREITSSEAFGNRIRTMMYHHYDIKYPIATGSLSLSDRIQKWWNSMYFKYIKKPFMRKKIDDRKAMYQIINDYINQNELNDKLDKIKKYNMTKAYSSDNYSEGVEYWFDRDNEKINS